MVDRPLFAKVQWWDSSSLYVQCPFCTKIHRHGFVSYDDVHRETHCNPCPKSSQSSYQFEFPFSQVIERTAYEIDKANKRHVALGADPPQTGSGMLKERPHNLRVAFKEKPAVILETWESAVEEITVDSTDTIVRYLFGDGEPLTVKRIDLVSGRMVFLGDEGYVREYLESSPESRIFLHGFDNAGKSSLWSAACERFPAVVELLLEQGANPDLQTEDGRTPLMVAALWGRCENVEHLLGMARTRTSRTVVA